MAKAILCALCITQPAFATDTHLELITPIGFAESQLWDCSEDGTAIGSCEIYDAAGKSIAAFPCIAKGESLFAVPQLEGYKHSQFVAVSNTGIAVGHVYSPADSHDVKIRAIVYDSNTSKLTGLESPLLGAPTIATSISKKGDVIGGVVAGKPCLWRQTEGGREAVYLRLPSEDLTALQVLLSDDGAYAVCALRSPKTAVLCVWRNQGERWEISSSKEALLSPNDVNNSGTVVGSQNVFVDGKTCTRGFLLTAEGQLSTIQPLDRDTFSTLRSVNNLGIAVGWSDAVGVAEKGPRGIRLANDKLTEIDFGATSVEASQAYAINDAGRIVGLLSRPQDEHSVGFVFDSTAPAPQHNK